MSRSSSWSGVSVFVMSVMCLCVFVRDTEGSRTPPCTMCVCVGVSLGGMPSQGQRAVHVFRKWLNEPPCVVDFVEGHLLLSRRVLDKVPIHRHRQSPWSVFGDVYVYALGEEQVTNGVSGVLGGEKTSEVCSLHMCVCFCVHVSVFRGSHPLRFRQRLVRSHPEGRRSGQRHPCPSEMEHRRSPSMSV